MAEWTYGFSGFDSGRYFNALGPCRIELGGTSSPRGSMVPRAERLLPKYRDVSVLVVSLLMSVCYVCVVFPETYLINSHASVSFSPKVELFLGLHLQSVNRTVPIDFEHLV